MPPRNRIKRQCTNCGKDIERPASQMSSEFVYCDRECQREHYQSRYKGSNNPDWKGGKRVTDQGYIRIRCEDHPRAVNGYVLEHILIMEKIINRSLEEDERVHHINHNRSDNRPENLKLYSTNAEHMKENHKRKKHPPCKCGRPAKGHGLCTRHLAQLRRTGRTWDFENNYTKWHEEPLCKICGEKAHCKGLCHRHYQQMKKHGKITIP